MESAKKAVESVTEGVKKVAIGGEGKKKEKKPAKAATADESGPLEMNPPADFLQRRLEMFDRLKRKQDDAIAKKAREPITITMPDGSIKPGTAWETTPGEIAKGISNSLYKRTVVARLDGDSSKLWDLDRPLEKSCKLELVPFDDEQGQMVRMASPLAFSGVDLHGAAGILAFERPHPRRGLRAKIRVQSLHRTPRRQRILLRDGSP
jgi:threonyl-tRNA synthetase